MLGGSGIMGYFHCVLHDTFPEFHLYISKRYSVWPKLESSSGVEPTSDLTSLSMPPLLLPFCISPSSRGSPVCLTYLGLFIFLCHYVFTCASFVPTTGYSDNPLTSAQPARSGINFSWNMASSYSFFQKHQMSMLEHGRQQHHFPVELVSLLMTAPAVLPKTRYPPRCSCSDPSWQQLCGLALVVPRPTSQIKGTGTLRGEVTDPRSPREEVLETAADWLQTLQHCRFDCYPRLIDDGWWWG